MAEQTRLAKLPGYDTAPDVYETPETAVEAPVVEAPEESTSESADSEIEANSDEDGPFGGVSHRRLFPERARSRFQAVGSRVEVRGLDLSDRVDGRRRGLQVKLGRADDETLEARIARLRREVEECRVLAQEDPTSTASIDALGKALTELEVEPEREERVMEHETDPQMLGKIAAFDSRLSSLEKALGIATMDMEADGSFTASIIPSMNLLDQQISALMASTSIAQLDAASGRIRILTQEAEKLARSQETAEGEEDKAISVEDMAKLNSLYALLPTMQGLAPAVPALLERLRSLTALHTGAAGAASELDAVVKKQADVEAELKSWEAGLARLESVVKSALEANGRNGKFVEGWVQELQTRMEALR